MQLSAGTVRPVRGQARRQSHRRSGLVCALVASAAAVAAVGFSPLTGLAIEAATPSTGEAPAQLEAAAMRPLDTASAELALLELTNADRAQNGLPPLSLDPTTLVIARERAASQLTAPSLSHYDASGQLAFVQLLAASGIDYQLAGENLARSTGLDSGVTQRVEEALMRSPTHRKNILEQTFTRVAIGAATDDQGRVTFAEIFRSE